MARYSKKASEKVKQAVHEQKRGTLKSGQSGKKVKSRKQAVAIGLSQARRAGAVGYLLKDAATGELELALRSVMRGESWFSPAVSRQVVEGYVQRVGGEPAADVLTARQREVLRLVAGGKSTKEIAFDLNLSVKTVETHRAQIMERLGIRDVAGLVRYALRTGLVPPDS